MIAAKPTGREPAGFRPGESRASAGPRGGEALPRGLRVGDPPRGPMAERYDYEIDLSRDDSHSRTIGLVGHG